MKKEEFEKIVREVGLSSVPEEFRKKIKNVAFLIEDEPSEKTREDEALKEGETLLGLYEGIPLSERGDSYGTGETLPDRITIYQKPTEDEAEGDFEKMKEIIQETIWHEVAHYFGIDHHNMREYKKKKEK